MRESPSPRGGNARERLHLTYDLQTSDVQGCGLCEYNLWPVMLLLLFELTFMVYSFVSIVFV